MELPTEGCDLGTSQTWAQRTNAVTRRTLFDPAGTEIGSWGYSYSLLGPPAEPSGQCIGTSLDPSEVSRTIVTKPDGIQIYNYFSVWPNFTPAVSPNGFRVEEYGMPYDLTQPDASGTRFLSTEVYEGGVLKRSTYVRYEYENVCTGDPGTMICSESNRRLASQRILYHDTGHYADTDFSDADGFGHYRTVTLGGNYPSGNAKVTTTNYNPGHTLTLDANLRVEPGFVMWPTTDPWVLDTYTEQIVTEGTQTIKTQACFDADTGALERTRALKGSTPNKNDVLASFTRDTFGNLQLEQYYGGDLQNVSTSSDLCALTLPSTSEYRKRHTYTSGTLSASRYQNANGTSVGFLTTDLTIDADTGLASASRDTAGIETAFEYDVLGRLLWEKPEAGQSAWVQYVYVPATSPTSLAAIRILHRASGKFTGHERDLADPSGTSDDLDYMHARFCSPLITRFTSADPVNSADPRLPQSWNKFSYVVNNPIKFVDPQGLAIAVFDAGALELIRATIPENLRSSVKTDSSGLINKSTINSADSTDENFLALRELVNLTDVIGVSTGAGFRDSGGNYETFEFESVEQIKEELTRLIGAEGIAQLDEIIPTSFLGIFLTPGDSPRGIAEVILSDGTGKAAAASFSERVVTGAHEIFGHALLFSRGEPFRHDKGKVDKTILDIERRTRKHFQ